MLASKYICDDYHIDLMLYIYHCDPGFILGFENKGNFNAKRAFYLNFDIFSSLSIDTKIYPTSLKIRALFQNLVEIPLPRINPVSICQLLVHTCDSSSDTFNG